MKFIQVEDVVLNAEHIVAVTEHIERVSIPSEDDLPFNEYESKVNGINVFTVICSEESHFVFKTETLGSFCEKLKEATQ
ncbi:hypothetical protein [Acinetobacter sp. KS-LM10]|uniref:hypothetical protein n=1 Tax=Acinetobacter sp. KS-LM10 TaxID=3120518 RepID=UPI0030D07D75